MYLLYIVNNMPHTHTYIYIFPYYKLPYYSYFIYLLICILLRIYMYYSGNYAGILDTAPNPGYSSASFKLVVVFVVMLP